MYFVVSINFKSFSRNFVPMKKFVYLDIFYFKIDEKNILMDAFIMALSMINRDCKMYHMMQHFFKGISTLCIFNT